MNHTMLDISYYIKNHLSKEDLLKLLKKGRGGSSIPFFARITGISLYNLATVIFVKKNIGLGLFPKDCKSYSIYV